MGVRLDCYLSIHWNQNHVFYLITDKLITAAYAYIPLEVMMHAYPPNY